MPSPTRARPPREVLRRLTALFSLEVFPFAVLLALALISILCRAWLMAKPLLAASAGI